MDTSNTKQIKKIAQRKSRIKKEGLFRPGDYIDELMDEFDHGYERGSTTFIPMVDNVFQWMRTYVNCFFGYGGHGKSEFLRQICLLKSKFDGYRWIIFAGENMSYKNTRVNANRYISAIAHTLLGKSPDPHWKNQPSKEQYREAIRFIDEHFMLIYPPELNKSPDLILEYFQHAIDTTGGDGVVVDPWNKLIHNYMGAIDEYLGKEFAKIKDFTVRNNLIFNICAHMSKEGRIKKDGTINKPSQHMLAGGAMWDNSMDSLVSLYKPNHGKPQFEDGKLPPIIDDPNLVIVTSHKIRDYELVAIPGDLVLYYRAPTRRFEFLIGVDNVYNNRRRGYNPLSEDAKSKLIEYEENMHADIEKELSAL